MIVVIDTNVLYQALRSSSGASHYIVTLFRDRLIDVAVSVEVLLEYEAVLTRQSSFRDLALSKREIQAVLDYFAYFGKHTEIYYRFRPNLPDEGDNIFVELALASNSEYLITNNVRDYKKSQLKFKHIKIITPAEFVRYWRKRNEE